MEMSSKKPNTIIWRVPGSELLQGVKYFVEYKRCYQQTVRLRHDGTVWNRTRWYYLFARWLKPGGCKCACFPKNIETYYKDSEWDNEDWSSLDEEGTIAAYDGEDKRLFYAYAKTGEKLKDGETILPYLGPINLEQKQHDPYITGRILVTRDKIMERHYNPAFDPYDWYMLPEDKALCKRNRHYDRLQRQLNSE
jgi:hypothetical protein